MRRRAVLVVTACVLVAACGAPHGTRTLEPDRALLTPSSSRDGLQHTTANELDVLARACPRLDGAIGNEVPNASTTSTIADLRCSWSFGFAAAAGNDAQLLVGILEDGNYRFNETGDLLDHERTVTGVGDAALYDSQTRALFALKNGRLWYVQVVGAWPARYPPQTVTTTIARALLEQADTR